MVLILSELNRDYWQLSMVPFSLYSLGCLMGSLLLSFWLGPWIGVGLLLAVLFLGLALFMVRGKREPEDTNPIPPGAQAVLHLDPQQAREWSLGLLDFAEEIEGKGAQELPVPYGMVLTAEEARRKAAMLKKAADNNEPFTVMLAEAHQCGDVRRTRRRVPG